MSSMGCCDGGLWMGLMGGVEGGLGRAIIVAAMGGGEGRDLVGVQVMFKS